MSYRCPLCLKELDERDRLARVCTEHPDESPDTPFECSEENLRGEIFCPRGGWCNGTIDSGVFLRHIGCAAKNPFWKNGAVDIPGRGNVTDYDYMPGANRQVNHWQIGMLRSMPNAEEMWFPLMLLRATSDENRNGDGKRLGVAVGLAGTQRVGKSVLAMLAMDAKGYVASSDKSRNVEVRGFLFSRLPEGRAAKDNPLLGNLYNHSLIMMNQDGLLPMLATPAGVPGDLKAAFIAPSKSSEAKASPERARSGQARARGLRNFLGEVFEVIRGIRELFLRPKHHSFWYTVLFYDASGESFVYGGDIPDQIERVADKIAVVIDAPEIFGMQRDPTMASSIAGASERIRVLRDKGLKCCLIVTKVDLVLDKLNSDEKDKIKRIAEDTASPEGEARAVLSEWLASRAAELTARAASGDGDQSTKSAHQSACNKLRQLANRLDLVDRVFFIWTEDLPPEESAVGAGVPHAGQPHSTGLAKFVCWCLDIKWNDINQAE